MEREVIPWCEKHGAALVAYSPFGHGDFPVPHTPAGRLLKETHRDASLHRSARRSRLEGRALSCAVVYGSVQSPYLARSVHVALQGKNTFNAPMANGLRRAS